MIFMKIFQAGLFLILILLVIYFLINFLNSKLSSEPGFKSIQVKNEHFQLEIADTSLKRAQGLSGRESMPENQGMLFVFDKPSKYAFWMKDMKFPLDIIWLNNNQIVYVAENAAPMTISNLKVYSPKSEADSVIELNAGSFGRLGLKIGDHLSF